MSDRQGKPARMRVVAASRNAADPAVVAGSGHDESGAPVSGQGKRSRSMLLLGSVFILGSALGGGGAALWLL